MRVTASYLYEGLVATAIEPYAADRDGVSAKGFAFLILSNQYRSPERDLNLGPSVATIN